MKTVVMGLESGSQTTLEYLKGKNISTKDHANAIRAFRKYGIKFYTSFIIGSPFESREDILETLRFIKENELNRFNTYVLMPFPGTDVWYYAKDKGMVNEQMDWDKLNINFFDNYENAIIMSEKLTRARNIRAFSGILEAKEEINYEEGFEGSEIFIKRGYRNLARRAFDRKVIVRCMVERISAYKRG